MAGQHYAARRLVVTALLVGTMTTLALARRDAPRGALAQPPAETPTAAPAGPSGAATPGADPAGAPVAPTEADQTLNTTTPGADPAGAPVAPTEADQTLNTATPTRTPTPINIGNFVWDDLDKDGRQDAGEPGIAGVIVQLWNSTKTALLDQDVTNASGGYTVVAPVPGNYRIRVLLPSGLDSFSPKDGAGGDDQKDSDINPSGTNFGFSDSFNLASNVISTTIHDAGIIIFRPPTPTRTPTPINIGNFVWVDLNQDGIQDAGEPGLGGVTVQLWNAARTQLIDQDVTNASGIYTVVAPLPGDYRIRVILPAGAGFAPKNAGANDQKDSDINRQIFLATYGFSDSFNLASNVISTTIHDAGLINVPATATPSRTPTGGATPTNTPTRTPTGTPANSPLERVYLPGVSR